MRPVTCKISKCIWWRKETGALRAPFLCADMGKGRELCFWGSLQCTSHFFLDELWKHHGLHQMRYMEFRGGGLFLWLKAKCHDAGLFTCHLLLPWIQQPFLHSIVQYYSKDPSLQHPNNIILLFCGGWSWISECLPNFGYFTLCDSC